MALFGEKYGDEVRVVSMGVGEGGKTYSVELCGGTHVRRTGDIALFRIVSESAVAAGVRRVEAVTGELAYDEARREHDLLESLAQSLKTAPADLPARLEALVEERRRLEEERREFETFMQNLRRARDQEEFDRFMQARRAPRPTGEDTIDL